MYGDRIYTHILAKNKNKIKLDGNPQQNILLKYKKIEFFPLCKTLLHKKYI